jgi:hypothetical protein
MPRFTPKKVYLLERISNKIPEKVITLTRSITRYYEFEKVILYYEEFRVSRQKYCVKLRVKNFFSRNLA